MRKLLRNDQSIVSDQCSARGSHSLLPIECQGDIGGARMLAREGPLGLAVSDDETARGGHRDFRLDQIGANRRREVILKTRAGT
jgi:hypothetical protein